MGKKKNKKESSFPATLTKDPGLTAEDVVGMRDFYKFFGIPLRAEMDAVFRKIETGTDTMSDINQLRLLLAADIAIGVHKMFRYAVFKSIRKTCREVISKQKD